MVEQSSVIFVRTLRELCGEYYPNETEPEERFKLTVNDFDVPVFAGSQTPTQYPEIRIHPFVLEDEIKYRGAGAKYLPGVAPGQDPNVMYRKRGVDLYTKTIYSEIEILSKGLETTLLVKDALFKRITRFILLEHAEVKILDSWEHDGNIYINANYDTGSRIIRVSINDETLLKTSEFMTTPDSWFWDGENLCVHTESPIEEVDFLVNANGGSTFHDGTDLFGRGFYNISIVKNKRESDKDPYVSKWVMRLKSRYQDTVKMDDGESFKQVNVND